MVKNGLLASLACVMWLCMAPDVTAQDIRQIFPTQYTGTLKKIKESGLVRLGHRENSPPFAFLDPKGRPIGYSLDLCAAVVEEIAGELRQDIGVEYQPVTPENRLDLVTSGAIDLECGSTTNTFERRKRVAFSPTIFVTGIKLLVRQSSTVRSLRDLQGKTVVVTRGTVHAEWMPKLAARQRLTITFVSGADHNESFQMLVAGKADAFANDDVQLYGMIAETRTTKQYRVVGDFLTYADYALMFRKDDPQLAEVVERAFTKLSGTRTIRAIYDRWFIRPLPSGIRLNLPMNPHMEELFKVQELQGD